MSTFKKGKVVMLPTNERVVNTKEYQLLLSNSLFWTSKIEIERYDEGWFFLKNSSNPNSCAITIPNVENFKHQHLYIISDDKIKEGDWCINTGGNIKDSFPFRVTKEVMNNKFIKKIIATTDTSLYIHQKETFYLPERVFYLPQPSQQFIQKFVEEYNKGREIKEVLVEYEDIIYNPEKDREYQSNDRINIEDCDKQTRLKINPKDNTITIKIVKDNWNREEVIELCKQAFIDGTYAGGFGPNEKTIDSETEKWIEENL